jgi:hypothetical protein
MVLKIIYTLPKIKHICNSHKPTHRPKIAKELALPTQIKIVFKKFPNALKKIEIHPHTAQQTQQTMSQKLNIDMAYTDKMDRRPAGNRRLAQWRVQWLIEHSTSYQLLRCIDSFVFRNPPLRQAPKRYVQVLP